MINCRLVDARLQNLVSSTGRLCCSNVLLVLTLVFVNSLDSYNTL